MDEKILNLIFENHNKVISTLNRDNEIFKELINKIDALKEVILHSQHMTNVHIKEGDDLVKLVNDLKNAIHDINTRMQVHSNEAILLELREAVKSSRYYTDRLKECQHTEENLLQDIYEKIASVASSYSQIQKILKIIALFITGAMIVTSAISLIWNMGTKQITEKQLIKIIKTIKKK